MTFPSFLHAVIPNTGLNNNHESNYITAEKHRVVTPVTMTTSNVRHENKETLPHQSYYSL